MTWFNNSIASRSPRMMIVERVASHISHMHWENYACAICEVEIRARNPGDEFFDGRIGLNTAGFLEFVSSEGGKFGVTALQCCSDGGGSCDALLGRICHGIGWWSHTFFLENAVKPRFLAEA